MRSTLRGALLALAAVFALGAFASASASAALPEFSPATLHTKFTGTFQEATIQEYKFSVYGCSGGGSISGEIANAHELGNLHIKFNCKGGFCTGKGDKLGTWETKELKARLGYINKKNKEVGLLFESATGPVAECESLTRELKIFGGLIGAVTPVNESRTGYTLTFRQEEGLQVTRHFEGEEVLHNLEFQDPQSKPKALGLQTTMTLTMPYAVEIRA